MRSSGLRPGFLGSGRIGSVLLRLGLGAPFRPKRRDPLDEKTDEKGGDDRPLAHPDDVPETDEAEHRRKEHERHVVPYLDGAEALSENHRKGENHPFARLHDRFGGNLPVDPEGEKKVSEKPPEKADRIRVVPDPGDPTHVQVDEPTEDRDDRNLTEARIVKAGAKERPLHQNEENVHGEGRFAEGEARDFADREGNRADRRRTEPRARDEDDARRRDEHPPDEQKPAAREPQKGRALHHDAFLRDASAAKGFGRFSASVSGVLSS